MNLKKLRPLPFFSVKNAIFDKKSLWSEKNSVN